MRDLPVRALRAWYYLRELFGRPKAIPAGDLDSKAAIVQLAGSPWTFYPASSSGTQVAFYVTNTTWPRRLEEEDVD